MLSGWLPGLVRLYFVSPSYTGLLLFMRASERDQRYVCMYIRMCIYHGELDNDATSELFCSPRCLAG